MYPFVWSGINNMNPVEYTEVLLVYRVSTQNFEKLSHFAFKKLLKKNTWEVKQVSRQCYIIIFEYYSTTFNVTHKLYLN